MRAPGCTDAAIAKFFVGVRFVFFLIGGGGGSGWRNYDQLRNTSVVKQCVIA